ncbi:MAG: carbohydrate kinase [Prevotella sp.]|nr:carbohydrate kinase [Candidatus Equicola stercoris]
MKIIGLGETVYDIIFKDNQPLRAVPGGSTFNAIISLGRTRHLLPQKPDIYFISETGDDHVGQMIIDFLHDSGVSSEFVTINKGTKSHLSLAFLDENSDAHYTFYKDHENADIPDNCPAITASDILLFGSFFAINPVLRTRTRHILQQAHTAGAMLYYDINFRRPHLAQLDAVMPNITENYSLATIVRGSLDDFDILYDTRDKERIYREYVSPYCPYLIITDGGNAITIFTPHTRYDYPVTALSQVVSTIGAGDNFNAGFLFAIANAKVSMKPEIWSSPEQSRRNFAPLVATAQHFSQAVCQSVFNYVEKDFRVSL